MNLLELPAAVLDFGSIETRARLIGKASHRAHTTSTNIDESGFAGGVAHLLILPSDNREVHRHPSIIGRPFRPGVIGPCPEPHPQGAEISTIRN